MGAEEWPPVRIVMGGNIVIEKRSRDVYPRARSSSRLSTPPAITNHHHLPGMNERIMTLAEIPASPLRSTAGAGAYLLSLSQSRGYVKSMNELGPNHPD